MRFYDFDGSEYTALIWAKDKEDAIKKYNVEVCDDCKVICAESDIDIVRGCMIKNITKQLQNYCEDAAKELATGAADKYLLNIISSGYTQVVLLDANLD